MKLASSPVHPRYYQEEGVAVGFGRSRQSRSVEWCVQWRPFSDLVLLRWTCSWPCCRLGHRQCNESHALLQESENRALGHEVSPCRRQDEGVTELLRERCLELRSEAHHPFGQCLYGLTVSTPGELGETAGDTGGMHNTRLPGDGTISRIFHQRWVPVYASG